MNTPVTMIVFSTKGILFHLVIPTILTVQSRGIRSSLFVTTRKQKKWTLDLEMTTVVCKRSYQQNVHFDLINATLLALFEA